MRLNSFKTFFIILLNTLLLLGSVYWGFSWWQSSQKAKGIVWKIVKREKTIPQEDYQKLKKYIGYFPEPGSLYLYQKTVSDAIVFQSHYRFGNLAQRVVSKPENSKRPYHLILSGGSNTFGEGVEDRHTLSFLLENSLKDHQVTNLSFRGFSPAQALSYLKFIHLKKEIPQEKGVFIYHFFPFHINRLLGYNDFLAWSEGYAPYWDWNEGWQFKGLFKDDPEYKIKILALTNPISKSQRKNRKHRVVIKNYPQEDLNKLGSFFVEMQRAYKKLYPQGRFVILLSPFFGESGLNTRSFLGDYLGKENIEVWDEGMVLNKPEGRWQIPGDGHMNEEAYVYLRDFILRQLKKAP